MQKRKLLRAILSLALFIAIFSGCQEDVNSPEGSNLTEKEALLKIALEDEAVGSFEPNYTDDEISDFLSKTNAEVYPVRIGRRITQVTRNFEVEIVGDTAYATLERLFEGIFIIPANYEPGEGLTGNGGGNGNGGNGGHGNGNGGNGNHGNNGGNGNFGMVPADTVIEKAFSTKIIQKIIFEKVDDTPFSEENWKVAALSLPEGGTLEEGVFQNNIEITRIVMTLPGGETIEVTEPNEFFVERGLNAVRNRMPAIGKREIAHILVEVNSAYPDTDLVTLTWGAGLKLRDKQRARLQLVSQEFDGQYYNKAYEAEYRVRINPGFSHSVINAMSKQSLFTDDMPVEENSWGIPYRIF